MTDDTGGEAAVAETTPKAAPEAAVSSQEQAPAERDFEAEAREQGWRPKEEWTGKPDNWKSAKVYVEHGEVNSRIAKIEKEYADKFDRLEKMGAKTVERLKLQHAKEMDELKVQKRAAIEAKDVAAVEKIDEAMDRLKDTEPGAEKKSDADIQREWMKANPWFEDDEELQVAALGYSNKIRSDDLSLEDNLKRTLAYVQKKFPDKFGEKKTAANGHAAVDGGGDLSGVFKSKDTLFSKLPPEAKAQCAKDVAEGLYKTNDEWAKVYFN